MNHAHKTAMLALRILIWTWVVLIGLMAVQIAATQFSPVRWWLRFYSVTITNGPDDVPIATMVRHIRNTREVGLLAELHAADDPSNQPCISQYVTVEENLPNDTSVVPLQKLLPFCNFTSLPSDRRWVVQLQYTVDLDYGIKKRLTVVSEPFAFDENRGIK